MAKFIFTNDDMTSLQGVGRPIGNDLVDNPLILKLQVFREGSFIAESEDQIQVIFRAERFMARMRSRLSFKGSAHW